MATPATTHAERPSSRPTARWLWPALACAPASYWLAAVYDAQLQVQAVSWLAIGFVVLPLLFTTALAIVAASATGLLLALSAPAVIVRRPTGLRPLLRDLWRLPVHVVPGFWTALRRARRPRLFGALLGFAAGTIAFVCHHGFVTPTV